MSSHHLFDNIDINFLKQNNYDIVEIGSAREPDNIDTSTMYFSSIAAEFNLLFFSVDLSEDSNLLAKAIVKDRAINLDGEVFLNQYNQYSSNKIGILYLDNYDVVYNDIHKKSLSLRVGDVYEKYYEGQISNQKSAEVHLKQVIAALPLLGRNAYVLLDDTKQIDGKIWWGKGAEVVPYLLANDFFIISNHHDGVLLRTAI